MLKIRSKLTIVLILAVTAVAAQTPVALPHFDKVIVSPHIQVTFVEGDGEKVVVEECLEPVEKLNIEVNNNTLRIYLDGAKEITESETVYQGGYKRKHSIYKGTIVRAIVTYKTLNELSIRGEETQVCQSPLKGDQFRLKIYGEPQVFLNEVSLGELRTTMYGEGYLEIREGSVKDQKYTVYGEGHINSLGIESNTARITAYGEADFRMNVSDEIKITAFGEASLAYKGTPVISKGLHIGELQIRKIDQAGSAGGGQ